jgi:lipopolysaccharide export system protein LptA
MNSTTTSLAVLCLVFWQSTVMALSEDRDKPMTVESDQAELDRNTNIGTYTGDVIIIQGTFELNADRVVVTAADGELSHIVATGEPADFRQRPDGADEDMTGHARQIDYFADKSLVVLTGNALVQQGKDVVESERIEYELENDIVRAVMVEGNDTRVQMILHPRKQQPEEKAQ